MEGNNSSWLLWLADDALILGQRLSEWCGHGPVLEEDIALSNVALDLRSGPCIAYTCRAAGSQEQR